MKLENQTTTVVSKTEQEVTTLREFYNIADFICKNHHCEECCFLPECENLPIALPNIIGATIDRVLNYTEKEIDEK